MYTCANIEKTANSQVRLDARSDYSKSYRVCKSTPVYDLGRAGVQWQKSVLGRRSSRIQAKLTSR